MGTDIRLPSSESPLAATLLTNGQETFPREIASSSVTQSTGVLRLGYFTARKNETAVNAVVVTAATPAGATPTLVRYGLYSVASNGNLTLIASTPNDTALLSVALTVYSKAFSVSVAVNKGARYAFGVLVVTGATAPTIVGGTQGGAAALHGLAPRLAGQMSSQTDLPSSVTAGSIVDTVSRPFGILTP